jgi:hypothetical protein
MRLLSVGMPSNRNFAESRRAIETALAYCAARDAILIVSDNSRDLEKARYWQAHAGPLKYIPDAPVDSGDNSMSVLRAVETPFFLSIGDDDELLINPSLTPVDLATLANDYIGVKPLIEMFLPGRGITKRNEYGIEADEPGARLIEYYGKNGGDNTTFYSIFRTAPFRSLIEFFITHHPTRGSFCDWQLVLMLLLQGKLASDPSTVYRYNASGWDTDEKIRENTAQRYVAAGLTADHKIYEMLLMGLDLYCFASRRDTGLSAPAVKQVMSGAVTDLMNHGLDLVIQLAGSLPQAIDAARKAKAQTNPAVKYLFGCAVLDHFVPGLKDRYIAFLKTAMSS